MATIKKSWHRRDYDTISAWAREYHNAIHTPYTVNIRTIAVSKNDPELYSVEFSYGQEPTIVFHDVVSVTINKNAVEAGDIDVIKTLARHVIRQMKETAV